MSYSPPQFAHDRVVQAASAAACDPKIARLAETIDVDLIAPPTQLGVQFRADWVADPVAAFRVARDGGFGWALATDAALRAPVADMLVDAVRLRAPDVLPEDLRQRFATAVHEAAVNACVHGNLGLGGGAQKTSDAYYAEIAQRAADQARAAKTLTLMASVADDALIVDVIDQGDGYAAPPPAQDAPAEGYSGRGVALMRAFADDVALYDDGRHIRLRFNLRPSGSSA